MKVISPGDLDLLSIFARFVLVNMFSPLLPFFPGGSDVVERASVFHQVHCTVGGGVSGVDWSGYPKVLFGPVKRMIMFWGRQEKERGLTSPSCS